MSCIQTSSRLSNRLYNRFDNQLYHVNVVLGLTTFDVGYQTWLLRYRRVRLCPIGVTRSTPIFTLSVRAPVFMYGALAAWRGRGRGRPCAISLPGVHMRRSDVTRHYSMKACRLARLCLHCRFESNNTFRVSRSLDDVKCIVVTRGLCV